MDIFIVSLITLICLNSLYSIKKGPLQILSFFLGWLYTELSFWSFLGLIAYLIFLFCQNKNLNAFVLVLGFVWFLTSCFHLVLSYRSKYKLASLLKLKSFPKVSYLKAVMTIPFLTGVHKVKNIPYGNDSKLQRIDIYLPKKPKDSSPVVLFIHGGAWILGSKSDQGKTWANAFVKENFIFVSMNYRLSPKATWPDHISDCKLAFNWIKENIEKYGGNPKEIIISGNSAGGHLASLLALDLSQDNSLKNSQDSVFSCLSLYGVYDLLNSNKNQSRSLTNLLSRAVFKCSISENPEMWQKASPLFRISENACPFVLIHGSNDSLVNVKDARIFAKALKDTSKNSVIYIELPFTQHAFEVFWSLRSVTVVTYLARYFKELTDKNNDFNTLR